MHFAPALVCILAVLLSVCPLGCAQSSKAETSEASKYANEPYVVEEFRRVYRFEADGKGQRDLNIRIRVQSESAVREFGLLVYPFSTSFENLEVLSVRVRKPDGTVVETPADDIQELDAAVSREAPMYTDEREKHIAVKSLAVGDVLEASVRWTVHDAIAPGHFWLDDDVFDKGVCLDQVLEFDIPAKLAVKVKGANPAPEVKEQNGRRIYTFHAGNLKKADDESKEKDEKVPDWEKNFRGIEPPAIRISSFSAWSEVGAWYASLQQPRVEVTPRIRATAEEITKGKSSEDEKIRAIYDYVSGRFRYIGVDLGVGRYTPHSAEDVLANRYGDCKDKHTLLAALLGAVAVQAYPVLISTKFKIDPEFPSASLFDHVITAIPRGDSYLFLDSTPEVAPYGLLMAGLRDHPGLVVSGDGPAKLVTTPADPPFLAREKFRMEASIDAKGALDGKARFEERGDPEIILRLAYRNTPQNQWKELTQRIVGRMGFGGTVSEVVATPPEKTADPFLLTYDYHRSDYSDWKESRITLPFPPLFLPELNEAQKKSKDPLPLGALQEVVYEATLKLPEGTNVIVPPNVEVKKDFAEYSSTYVLENGTLRGTRRLAIKLREVPGDQRSTYMALFQSMQDDLQRWILILNTQMNTQAALSPVQKAGQLLQQDEPEDAVELLEKALKDDPENQQIALALGSAYLRETDPEEDNAVAQFEKLLKDKPTANTLNSIAYSYADANVRLKEALDYVTRSVSDTSSETMKASLESDDPDDFLRMAQLAAEWDTLGWAQFRSGDAPAAEKYLKAAWALWQRAVIGEHLMEVEEKLGKKSEAFRIGRLASLAQGRGDEPNTRYKLKDFMATPNPYKPRSTSPTFSESPSDLRTIHVPGTITVDDKSKLAFFTIAVPNGGGKAHAHFVSGDKTLMPEAKVLANVDYHQPFPSSTPVTILRAGYLSCSKYATDCTLIFLPVDDKPGLEEVKNAAE
jgi:transglutaminase-like putative cysteine protease